MNKFNLLISILVVFLAACSSPRFYEADVFPGGKWKPVNPEFFDKDEAQRIMEGGTPK